MSLHRLLGFRAAVADPTAVDAYYGELGLRGNASSGYSGSDGGGAVVIDEAPFRRLIAVDIGCHDDRDVDAVQQRLEARGASPTRGSASVSVPAGPWAWAASSGPRWTRCGRRPEPASTT